MKVYKKEGFVGEAVSYTGEPTRLTLLEYNEKETSVAVPSEIDGVKVGYLSRTFQENTTVEEVVVSGGVMVIGDETFRGCTQLKRVVLPRSIRVIGQKAFHQCPNLEEVVISSLEMLEIHQEAFELGRYPWNEEGELIIKTVLFFASSTKARRTISEGVTKMRANAMLSPLTLKELCLPDSLSEIEMATFETCTNLEKVVLPKGLKKIPEKAFCNTALKRIKIPASVEELGVSCFKGCEQLWKAVFETPSSLKVIGSYAFLGCNLQSIVIPTSVERIDEYVFYQCESLVKAKIPSKTLVKKGAFPYPDTMELLQPKLVEGFNQWEQNDYYKKHFYRWNQFGPKEQKQLKKGIALFLQQWDVCLPLEEKENVSFLTELFEHKTEEEMSLFFDLGFTLTQWEFETFLRHSTQNNKVKITAFLLEKKKELFTHEETEAYETRKEQVEMGLELPTLEELGRTWYLKRREHGVCVTGYRGENGREELPSVTADGVKVLGAVVGLEYSLERPFGGLTFLKLSEGMELGEYTFKESALQEIQIPYPVRLIPGNCFEGGALERVTLPEGLEGIGEFAFKGVELEEVVLPSTLKALTMGCFSRCSKLKRVIFRGSMEVLERKCSYRHTLGVFKGCTSLEFVGMEGGENQLERLKEEGVIES